MRLTKSVHIYLLCMMPCISITMKSVSALKKTKEPTRTILPPWGILGLILWVFRISALVGSVCMEQGTSLYYCILPPKIREKFYLCQIYFKYKICGENAVFKGSQNLHHHVI